jgi:glycosyltransferase involved in cell wall biosynthesis
MGEEANAPAEAITADSKAPQISVIVPTRNEADNVAPLLDRLIQALGEYTIEVLFVDDSTDDTVDVLMLLRAESPVTVRVIARPPEDRNGLSGAVVDGLRAAHGEWVCVMDADLQHPPETIPRMWEQARRTGADIVVGSRRGDLFGPLGLSRLRSLNSKTLTILARMLFPRVLKNVSDPLTGLFLVRRTAVDVDSLQPSGFKILLEILVRCPTLQVTEVHFDFAPRHGGESKADFREGGRFFQHLVRLRTTANAHLGRFIIILLLGLLGNTLLLALLTRAMGLSLLVGGLLAAEAAWLGLFFAAEYWIFPEREHRELRRRFWGHFLLTQLTLLFIYVPVVLLLELLGFPWPLVTNLLALLVVGLVRYLLSEQWVWTRGSIVWQPQSYTYDIHGLIAIESQVPLRDLAYFAGTLAPEEIDLQIRVDRQGTPTRLPGGISYDEHLGRFGFGLTVLPGDYTQVVVSPLLEGSPEFLYTNVVEPVLRWRLVHLGYALVKGAAVAAEGRATLLNAERDMAPVVTDLCRTFGYGFMADDLTILSAGGQVYCYPKPVTVSPEMLDGSAVAVSFSRRVALRGQQLLYTRLVRRVGLWLSRQDLPAASFNTYLQRLIPQPKRQVDEVYPEIGIVNHAALATVAYIPVNAEFAYDPATLSQQLAQSVTAASFQPHPLLAERLRDWEGVDLIGREQEIITMAVENVKRLPLDRDAAWWEALGFGIETDVEKSIADELERPVEGQNIGPEGNAGTL